MLNETDTAATQAAAYRAVASHLKTEATRLETLASQAELAAQSRARIMQRDQLVNAAVESALDLIAQGSGLDDAAIIAASDHSLHVAAVKPALQSASQIAHHAAKEKARSLLRNGHSGKDTAFATGLSTATVSRLKSDLKHPSQQKANTHSDSSNA